MTNEKTLFKMGEMVELLGITPRTIRYYDQNHHDSGQDFSHSVCFDRSINHRPIQTRPTRAQALVYLV